VTHSCHYQRLLAPLHVDIHLCSLMIRAHDIPSESHSLVDTSFLGPYLTFHITSQHTISKTNTHSQSTPNMVVFKKRCTPVTNARSQGQKQKDKIIPTHEAATSAQLKQQVGKATFGTLRYSDMVAGRKSTLNVSPIKKLVDTFELFEQVLDYLPMKEVLRATRVCRAFETNIENSSRLQAKLFLAPDLTIKKLAVSSKDTLLSGVKAEQHITVVKAAGPSQGNSGGEVEFYNVHPALDRARMSDRYTHMGMVGCAKFCIPSCTDTSGHRLCFISGELQMQIPKSIVSTLPETSSLNKMFLSQPPVKEIDIRYTFRELPRNCLKRLVSARSMTICREAGIRFGDVIMDIRSAIGLKELSSHFVEIYTSGGFVVNARARVVAEMAGELCQEDDPTRWGQDGTGWVLKDGCFAFT
jgi:hypothetical protein